MADVMAVLNDLVETSKDGDRGFRKAAEDAQSAELKALFLERADLCARGARELQDAIQGMGGKPGNGGSLAGTLHRGWVDVRLSIRGRTDRGILAECEKAEDVAKARYEAALAADLPDDVRPIVKRHYDVLIRTYDRIRALRDAASS
jgi:uncharacterized protein (TIGR02284 family)